MNRKATVKSLEYPEMTVAVAGDTAIVRHLWVSETELDRKTTHQDRRHAGLEKAGRRLEAVAAFFVQVPGKGVAAGAFPHHPAGDRQDFPLPVCAPHRNASPPEAPSARRFGKSPRACGFTSTTSRGVSLFAAVRRPCP